MTLGAWLKTSWSPYTQGDTEANSVRALVWVKQHGTYFWPCWPVTYSHLVACYSFIYSSSILSSECPSILSLLPLERTCGCVCPGSGTGVQALPVQPVWFLAMKSKWQGRHTQMAPHALSRHGKLLTRATLWQLWQLHDDELTVVCNFDKVSIINVSGPADGDDDTDRGVMKSAKSRSSSVPAHKNRNTFSTPKPPSGEKSQI